MPRNTWYINKRLWDIEDITIKYQNRPNFCPSQWLTGKMVRKLSQGSHVRIPNMWETLCPRAAPGYDTPTNPCILTPSGYPVFKKFKNTLVIPNLHLSQLGGIYIKNYYVMYSEMFEWCWLCNTIRSQLRYCYNIGRDRGASTYVDRHLSD